MIKINLFFLFSVFLFTVSGCQSEKKYKIAYNVAYDIEKDDYEIFIMDMDGRNKKNISNREGVDWVYYAWKDKIFFISDRDTIHRTYFLYVMDADGKNVRKISNLQLRDS
ncbi:MAG: TolB family protein, partial [Calditrichaceae bacterium]